MKAKNPFKFKQPIPELTWQTWTESSNGISWCVSQWGPGGYQKESHWYHSHNPNDEVLCFHFRDEADLTLFVLKWL